MPLDRFFLPREDIVGDKGEGGELPGSDGQVLLEKLTRINIFWQAPCSSPGLPPSSLDRCLCQHSGDFKPACFDVESPNIYLIESSGAREKNFDVLGFRILTVTGGLADQSWWIA